MEVLLRAKLHKPDRMPNKEFFGVWKQEAQAALAALKAGRLKHLWKVPGKYEVIAVVGVDSVGQMDEIMHSLPIWKLGYDYIIDIEWTLLRPYEEWAKQLDELAEG
jgi:muconolactone delta-isomerase